MERESGIEHVIEWKKKWFSG